MNELNIGPLLDPDRAHRTMDLERKEELLAAAKQARQAYPGPVGELLHQELVSWIQFGHMLGSELIFRVASEIGANRRTTQLD